MINAQTEKNSPRFMVLLAAVLVAVLTFISRAQIGPAEESNGQSTSPSATTTPVITSAPGSPDMVKELNFANAPVEQVIQLYAQLTGRTAIYPSNLQPTRIVLQANGPLTKEDALRALENVLMVNGFAIIPQGDKFF